MNKSRQYGWGDLQISIGGVLRSDVTGILYKTRQEKVVSFGTGENARSVQRGAKKHDGFIYMKQSCINWLQDQIDSGCILDLQVDIVVTYGDASKGDDVRTDKLYGVEFIEEAGGMMMEDMEKEYCIPFVFLKKE
jgi:hypothetical protein